MYGSRRAFCRGLTLAGLGSVLPLGAGAGAEAVTRYLDLDDPEDALTAMIKMRGSLLAEDVPHWYTGTIYAVLPGAAPVRMVDFEGSEIDYYERQPDGSFHAYGATVSFFRDFRTGKLLDTFQNPVTGNSFNSVSSVITASIIYYYLTN